VWGIVNRGEESCVAIIYFLGKPLKMKFWDFTPPPASDLGDHDVPLEGNHLAGKRIALLLTGSIAAFKAPLLARSLRRQGAEVVAFASPEALRYVTPDVLEWSTTNPVITELTPAAEHLSDNHPFALYLLAPATYNTVNKFRYGIADGVITSTLASALGKLERSQTRILIAPTMHGSLHNSILTASLRSLASLGIEFIAPRQDYGKHNLPPEEEIVAAVCRSLSLSPLKGKRGLITGGPTPVPLDSIRLLTNRFTGRLGATIAQELYLRGADICLIQGQSSFTPPPYLPQIGILSYADYQQQVFGYLEKQAPDFAIFSAAVADYQPEQMLAGKTPSGKELNLRLIPTAKVIEMVRENFPDLYMMTFKYQEGISHAELMTIAQERLGKYQAVVANRGEEQGESGEQIAYLLTHAQPPVRLVGKGGIAEAIAVHLETIPF
jgi:phosphopantothenoylcysteine decarboxylase/phosphopantothenate--cysteine ligase